MLVEHVLLGSQMLKWQESDFLRWQAAFLGHYPRFMSTGTLSNFLFPFLPTLVSDVTVILSSSQGSESSTLLSGHVFEHIRYSDPNHYVFFHPVLS